MKQFYPFVLGLFMTTLCSGQQTDYKPDRTGTNTFYYAKWKYYAFYDVVRQMGAGVVYSPHPNFELNADLGYIDPNICHTPLAAAADYFMYKGGALNLSAVHYARRNQGFYLGIHCSFSIYGYQGQWLPKGGDYNSYPDRYREALPYMEYRDRQMTSFATGMIIGWAFRGEDGFTSLFLKVGGEQAKGTIHVTQVEDATTSISYSEKAPNTPYTYTTRVGNPYIMAGFAMGIVPKSKPAYMYRYYKELYRNRMIPLIDKAVQLRRKGVYSAKDVMHIRNMAHSTYERMKRNYPDAVFDATELEKILDEGAKQIEDMLANSTQHKK